MHQEHMKNWATAGTFRVSEHRDCIELCACMCVVCVCVCVYVCMYVCARACVCVYSVNQPPILQVPVDFSESMLTANETVVRA